MNSQISTYRDSKHKLMLLLKDANLLLVGRHICRGIRINKKNKRNFIDDRTWSYQTVEDIQKQLPYFSVSQIRRFIAKLVKMKILKKGNFNKKSNDHTTWYSLENEELLALFLPDEIVNSSNEIVKAIPKSIPSSLPKGKEDLGLEDKKKKNLDAQINKSFDCNNKIEKKKKTSKVLEAKETKLSDRCFKKKSPQQDITYNIRTNKKDYYLNNNYNPIVRFKLNPEQTQTFNILKSLNIDAPDEKLCFWAKVYDCQRLLDVYNEAKFYGARSYRTYMSKLLESNRVVNNALVQSNADFAKDFAKSHGWSSLKINKTYLTFPMGRTTDEISLSMPTSEFINRLCEKYENSSSLNMW